MLLPYHLLRLLSIKVGANYNFLKLTVLSDKNRSGDLFHCCSVMQRFMIYSFHSMSQNKQHLLHLCQTLFSVSSQAWNVLALDGSNWQKIDLFNFQTDIEVSRDKSVLLGLPSPRWVALPSLKLCAGAAGFGVDCDVSADAAPRRPGLSSLSFSQGRVVENISKRCGGFLRQLSLRGCLSVGDASMK